MRPRNRARRRELQGMSLQSYLFFGSANQLSVGLQARVPLSGIRFPPGNRLILQQSTASPKSNKPRIKAVHDLYWSMFRRFKQRLPGNRVPF